MNAALHSWLRRIPFAMLIVFSLSGSAQTVKHVVIISIDGFRPDFYRDPSWGTINMRQLAASGISADGVNSVFPTLTFPNHTTIITGARPANHGIYFNAPFTPGQEEESDAWYWYAKDIKTKTLWEAAKDAGLVTASVNWPVSAGAAAVDYNIPIIKGKGKSQLAVTAENSTPPGILDTVQIYATGKFDQIDFNTNADYLVMDENVARISGYIFRRYHPGLLTLRLSCVDHFEHIEGRSGELVSRAVSGADRAIRTVLESVQRAGLQDSTVVIVTGDHGFAEVEHILTPNNWLKEAGLITDKGKGDWKAWFNTSGGSAFLYLKDPADQKTKKKVMDLLASRPEMDKKLFKVISKAQLDNIKADPRAALAIATIPGYRFHNSLKPIDRTPSSKGTHGYFPDFQQIQTGFIACGPGLKTGIQIPVMGLEDIAPIVSKLMGLSFTPKDGHLPEGILTLK